MSDSSCTVFCQRCHKNTVHLRKHREAFGIPDTHVAGSEHFCCENCHNEIYSEEGEKLGLVFILDGARQYFPTLEE